MAVVALVMGQEVRVEHTCMTEWLVQNKVLWVAEEPCVRRRMRRMTKMGKMMFKDMFEGQYVAFCWIVPIMSMTKRRRWWWWWKRRGISLRFVW